MFSLFKDRQIAGRNSRKKQSRQQTPAPCRRWHVERLEERLALVVGAFSTPLPELPGREFDGVVALTPVADPNDANQVSVPTAVDGLGNLLPAPSCTGTLLSATSQHILTAAHCVDHDGITADSLTSGADHPVSVRFDVARGHQPVVIPIKVDTDGSNDVSSDRIRVHDDWIGVIASGLLGFEGDDIALLTLTDQEPGFESPTRHLVAPYSNSSGRGYELFTDDIATPQEFTLVGYGTTGIGYNGHHNDEIQLLAVNTEAGFTLGFLGIDAQVSLTPAASAEDVAAALETISLLEPILDANGDVVARSVVVQEVDDNSILEYGAWLVRFVGPVFSGMDQDPLTVTLTNPDDSYGFAAPIIDGGETSGIKRSAKNEFDGPDIDRYLHADFDNGDLDHSETGGLGLGESGVPYAEGLTGFGDSGGPALIKSENRWKIAGVTSFGLDRTTNINGNDYPNTKDFDDFTFSDGSKYGPDSSFGEEDFYTRVSAYLDDFIYPVVQSEYDLVLDMNYQVLGITEPGEDITITARRNGDDLELEISGSGTEFDGVYFSGRADQINSLTIRGSNDNETIRLVGNLGIETINVVGRGNGGGPTGIDKLVIDRSDEADRAKFTVTNQTVLVETLQDDDATIGYDASLEALEIDAGPGNDDIYIQSTSASTPLTVNAGAGNDLVAIGGLDDSLNGIQGAVTASAGAGNTDVIHVNDQGNGAITLYILTATTVDRLGAALITYDSFNEAVINGGNAGNIYDVQGTSPFSTTLNSGTGADIVFVRATTGSLTVNGQSGLDDVTISDGGTTQQINGAVTVTNAASRTALTIDDSASGAAAAILNSTSLTGLAPAAIHWVQNDLQSLVILGGTGGNTLTVADTPVNFLPVTTTLNSGTGADTVTVQRTTGPITINGQSGQDNVTITNAGSVQQINGTVTVTNGSSYTGLTIDDSNGPAAVATLNAASLVGLSPAVINWVQADLRSLVINGGTGGNTFTVADTPVSLFPMTTTLNSGVGVDTVTVQRTTGPLTVNGQNGLDNVTITNAASAQQINGAVTVRNSGGHTALNIDDSADPAARTAMLGDTSLTGLAPATINWVEVDLSSLVVHGGGGSNTFTVADTPLNLFPVATTLNSGAAADVVTVMQTGGLLNVNAGGGNDSLHVGTGALALLQSPVAVNGEDGIDMLTVNDQANSFDHAFTVTPTAVHYLALPFIPYDHVESLLLNAGSGKNVITVAPSAGTTISIDGGAPVLPTLPGDTLVLDLAGVDSPQQTVTSPSSGQYTFGNRQPVNYTNIETAPSVQNVGIIVVGTDIGRPAQVRVFDSSTRDLKFRFQPYGPAFRGGVRVATGDVNGDGVPDIITSPGPGRQPQIRLFDGTSGQPLAGPLGSFLGYEKTFLGGVYVAAGDVNGDGFADIIASRGTGKPEVRVFSGLDGRRLSNFLAYNARFSGGVYVAAGDVNGDGFSEIITGPGVGRSGPRVKVFNGMTGAQLASFFAYSPNFQGGVFVAAGDLNGDGKDDIITGAGRGGAPQVKVFDATTLQAIDSFFAYDQNFRGGVRVAVGDVNGDGRDDIITAAGSGAAQKVRLIDGPSLAALDSFFALDPKSGKGLFVAGSR